jgi:hypothetical protein
MLRLSLLLTALAAATIAQAADEPPIQVFDVESRVTVDASGAVTQVQPPATLPRAFADAVAANVRRLRFLPPVVDGVPVQQVQTNVREQACAATVGANYELSMAYREHGPSLLLRGSPATPDEVQRGDAAGKAGFVLSVDWSAQGKPSLAQMDGLEANSIYHQDYLMKQSILRWLRSAQLQPEHIDGKARATQSKATVRFSASAPMAQVEFKRGSAGVAGQAAVDRAALPKDCATALAQDRNLDAERALYLESVLKLKPRD